MKSSLLEFQQLLNTGLGESLLDTSKDRRGRQELIHPHHTGRPAASTLRPTTPLSLCPSLRRRLACLPPALQSRARKAQAGMPPCDEL